MSALPRMTIITPSFNQGHYIEQTIRSVLDQGYPDLEYIVMDGGSTDETVKVLKKYEHRLQWLSEADRGQAHAINKGLRRATGEVIAFLNSDDLYEPGALLEVGEFFAQKPQACWLTAKCRIIDQRGREIRKPITLYKNAWLRFGSHKVLQVINYISQPATFWRRVVIDEVGFLDETLSYTMDYDYWLRLGRRFRLSMLNRFVASFRVYADSKGGTSAIDQFGEELETTARYVASPTVLGLHRAHNSIILKVYSQLGQVSR